MKTFAIIAALGLMSVAASAESVDFNTNGSTLSCGTAVGCTVVTNTATLQVIKIGNFTLTYVPDSFTATDPSPTTFIDFGSIQGVDTGTLNSANVANFAGATLHILINVTANDGSNGSPNLVVGVLDGTFGGTALKDNSSNLLLTITTPNTTTVAGTYPGSTVTTGYDVLQFQSVLTTQVFPAGLRTSPDFIQGFLSEVTPEPTSYVLMGAGLGALALLRRRRTV